MKKSNVQCPDCAAGYRRIELTSKRGRKRAPIAVKCVTAFLRCLPPEPSFEAERGCASGLTLYCIWKLATSDTFE
jgi:hypothetical protein